MTDTDRIIEAVEDEVRDAYAMDEDGFDRKYGDTPITTALVNLAMSGVCPECGGGRAKPRVFDPWDGAWVDADPQHFPDRACSSPYHDHREALDALIAERTE